MDLEDTFYYKEEFMWSKDGDKLVFSWDVPFFPDDIVITVSNFAEIHVYPVNENASNFIFKKHHIGDSRIDVITYYIKKNLTFRG